MKGTGSSEQIGAASHQGWLNLCPVVCSRPWSVTLPPFICFVLMPCFLVIHYTWTFLQIHWISEPFNNIVVQLLSLTLVIPWTVGHQAPLFVAFSRQEYWSVLPFPPPWDLPHPGIKPESSASPALAGWVSHLGSLILLKFFPGKEMETQAFKVAQLVR